MLSSSRGFVFHQRFRFSPGGFTFHQGFCLSPGVSPFGRGFRPSSFADFRFRLSPFTKRVSPNNDTLEKDEKDEILRLIFDDTNVWNEFTHRSRTFSKLEVDTPPSTRKFTGLFRNPELTSPQGFQKEAEKAVRRVKLLINRITNANTDEELRKVVKNLDRLSDILCSVIDTAEFVRTVHPDQKFSHEANRVYEYLCSFMNSLNTNRELYQH